MKYTKGGQIRRATQFGYWKATGKQRDVKSGARVVGSRRTLVFHKGHAPNGKRTEWIMHEYSMSRTPQVIVKGYSIYVGDVRKIYIVTFLMLGTATFNTEHAVLDPL